MKYLAALFLAFAIPLTALAETTDINIPGEGWKISFDLPTLSNKQEAKKGLGNAVKGNSGRFNLSLFVEETHGEGKSNKDVYDFYWTQASRNPIIAKETVVTSNTPQYVRVQYDIMAEFQGRRIRQKNINYYFVYKDRWVDLHISVVDPKNEDENISTTFDKSLTYSASQPSTPITHSDQPEIHSYAVPQHGLFELLVPSSWIDSVQQPPGNLLPTIRFVAATGNPFELSVTLLWSQKPGENINEPSKIKAMITNIGQNILPTVIEKELKVFELKNGDSVRYYYVVTDKAPKPGDFPIMVQGAIGIGELQLSFTLLENKKETIDQRTALNMLINGKHNM